MDLKEMRWEDVVHLIHSPQERGQWLELVNTAMKLHAPQNAGNFEYPNGHDSVKKGCPHDG
jgi:hypothetical protein